MSTMKAAVVRAFDQPLAIEEVPVPRPGAGDVLVKIEACGVWRELNWLKTVISTRPITSHTARFLNMLFKMQYLSVDLLSDSPKSRGITQNRHSKPSQATRAAQRRQRAFQPFTPRPSR